MLPDPGGLFLVEKKTGEKLSGWLRIGQDSVPYAELSRTSSYPLMPSSTAARQFVATAAVREEEQPVATANHYFCKVRM